MMSKQPSENYTYRLPIELREAAEEYCSTQEHKPTLAKVHIAALEEYLTSRKINLKKNTKRSK